jgi:hypothetical protein
MEVKLERMDWEEMKETAIKFIRRDTINIRINREVLKICEEEISKLENEKLEKEIENEIRAG